MNIFVFLAFFTLAKARILTNNYCHDVVVSGINHEKQVLKGNVDSPYQLAIEYDTSTLFFSYSANTKEVFKSCYLNLKTNEYAYVSGIDEGFANGVDTKRHTVYLGGRYGIYQFDFNTKTATNQNITKENIWQLFYKDGLYFTTYPQEKAYIYKNNEVKMVPELQSTKAMLVAVDNDNNIFFSNSSGLFCYKRIDDTFNFLGEYTINGFTSDINGKVYFSTHSGIYAINEKQQDVVEQLASIDEVFGLAIEGDGNIIYAAGDSIIRLKSTGVQCISELTVKSYEVNNL